MSNLTRVEQAATKSLKGIVSKARADIALVNRRKHEIATAFYDMGQALQRLKRPEVWRALGHESFASMCDVELEMSVSQADWLIAIVQHMTKSEAAKLGAAKAAALADLVDATPAKDTVKGALSRGVKLPSGKKLNARTASSRAIGQAAKAARAASKPATKRGRHVSPEDVRIGAQLAKHLRAAGAKGAKVTIVAGLAGQRARVKIEVGVEQLGVLAKAIRAT